MIPMPPLAEIVDALKFLVAPPLAASAVVSFPPRPSRPLPALWLAVAFAVAVAVGNFSRKPVPWVPDAFAAAEASEKDKAPSSFVDRLLESRGRDQLWIATAIPLLVAAGLQVASAPAWLAWLLRIAAAFGAAWLLTPVQEEFLSLSAVAAASWIVLHYLGRRSPPVLLPIYLLFPLGAAAFLSLYCSLNYMDVAVIAACAVAGQIPVVFWKKPDPTLLAAPMAVLIPGLMLVCKTNTYSDVPPVAFLLVGLSPLAVFLSAIPTIGRQRKWWLWLIEASLAAGPLVVALVLAMRTATLPF